MINFDLFYNTIHITNLEFKSTNTGYTSKMLNFIKQVFNLRKGPHDQKWPLPG